MWTTIKNEDVDAYANEYPELAEDMETYKLYEGNGKIILPRQFYMNYPSQHLNLSGSSYQGDPIDLKFNSDEFPLRPDQAEIINTLAPIYRKQKFLNGVIKARPGAGKTVLAIYLASLIGQKALFLVDNSKLMDQWVKEILTFTNLKPANIGIIKQKFFGIEEPVCVGMVQSLLSKFKTNPSDLFKKLNDANYGFVSFDEVHKSASSEKYSKISTLFKTQNLIGLSATPYKYGAQDILMKNTIGELLYESSDYDLKPQVNFVFYESKTENYRFMLNKTRDYIRKKGVYNSFIYKSQKYLDTIVKHVQDAVINNNHRMIIICSTQKQVEAISKALDVVNLKNRMFYGKQKEFKETDKILVATYAYAGHGFNYKELSALLLACPLAGKVSIIQTVGRILRECIGKTSPVVYDLVDLSHSSMFLPDLQRKKKIFEDEFSCEFNEITEYNKNVYK